MSDEQQGRTEHDVLADVGETGGVSRPSGEGGGGAAGDESFTMGGPRGQDAERGEYYEPAEDEEDDDATGEAGR